MNILVTGAAGYIGSILVPKLLNLDYSVTAIDNFLYKQSSLLDICFNKNLRVIRGDARDVSVIREPLSKADIIIPLAALVGAPLCDFDQLGAISTNLDAIKSIVNMVSSDQRIIMPVSNSGYGVGEKNQFCTEESELKPISLYGKTKVDAEKIVLSHENSITFRLATVFGASPRMRTDLLVNDFVYRAINDKFIVIFEGHFKRNYIHIQDVANVFLHALIHFDKMKGEAYNVGLEEANLSKLELATKIKQYIPNFQFFEASIGQDPDKRDYIVSNKKIIKTGFSTSFSLDDGIHELINAYKIIREKQYANI